MPELVGHPELAVLMRRNGEGAIGLGFHSDWHIDFSGTFPGGVLFGYVYDLWRLKVNICGWQKVRQRSLVGYWRWPIDER